MSQILKTITASFDTVDLAELAAKNIKTHFNQVKAITIKYKNYPESGERHQIHSENLKPSASMTALSAANYNILSNGPLPGYLPGGVDNFAQTRYSQSDVPEIETTTESHLIIKASEDEIHKIESHLRGMGGQQILIS